MLNPNMVQSALARPYVGYYRALHKKAAALVESMAKNHGFIDGNKRTTVILTHVLISESGYELQPLGDGEDLDEAFEQLVLDAVRDVLDFDGVAAWFQARLRRAQ